MRNFSPCLGAAMLVVLAAACAPLATRWDYDPDADFPRYRTFDWMPAAETADSDRPAWDHPFLEKRIKQAVISAMQNKGFEKVSQDPDLLVAYRVSIKKKTDVHLYGYRHWGPQPVEVQRFREGTLIIDLVDPRTRQLIWRGWGVGDFDAAADPGTSQEYLSAAVKDILAHYPPY